MADDPPPLDPTAAIDPFAIMPAASPPTEDPYAGLTWPPTSWGVAPGMPVPAPFDAAPGIVGPPLPVGAPPIAPPVDATGAPSPAAPEPVLPPGALTRDRAPTDTTGSAPINVAEALNDPQRGAPAVSSEQSEHDRLRQQYISDPLNEEAAKYLTPQERGAALEAMSPQQFAAYAITKQNDKASRDQAEQAKLKREQDANEEREWKIRQDARAVTTAQQVKLNNDVAAALKEKNPTWWESRSTGQKILGGLAAIVGGLSMGAGTGYHGPNLGLQIMDQAANEYDQNMRANQEQKRALLGQQQASLSQRIQADNEDFHDRTVHRLAMYESAKQTLLGEQQKYDPQGTTALQIGAAVRGIDQQQAVAQQAYQQKTFDNNVKLMGETHKQAELVQKTKQDLASNQLRSSEIYTTQRGQNLTNQQHNDTIALERDKIAATKDEKAAIAKDKADKDASEHSFGVFPQTTVDANGKPVGVEYKPALNKDGKEFVPRGRPEDVSKLREKSVAVTDMAQIMDRVQRLRTGWSNSVHDREELQKIQALWALNKVNFKNYAQLGALSESDYSLVDKGLGTSDPTKFLDQSAGIKEARGAIVHSLNTSMRALGYDNPKDFEIADTSATNAPVKDAIDMLGEGINVQTDTGPLHNRSEKDAADRLGDLYSIASGERLTGSDPATVARRQLYDDPANRAKALQYLKEASENAPSEKVKEEAGRLYNGLIGPQFAPGTGTENPPNVAGKPMNEGG